MEVTIRCYGAVSEAVGARSLVRVLEAESTVGDVIRGLSAEFDAFDPDDLDSELACRVNGAAADPATRLSDGDAVALSERESEE